MRTLKNLIKSLGAARERLIFISYPTKQSLDGAYKISHYWWVKGYIVICPKILFSYMTDDHDRPVIMIICKMLILLCPVFKLYGNSAGCMEEYYFAKKHHKVIDKLIPEPEKIDFKRMMESNSEVIL